MGILTKTHPAFIMNLVTILILLACAASSSALFGPLPYLGDIVLAKAGLGLLASKGYLLSRFLRKKEANNNTVSYRNVDVKLENNDCVDEVEMKWVNICKNVTREVCEMKPVEECHQTMVNVCKDVDEEVCKDKEEEVCEDVSKNDCTDGSCETDSIPKCSIKTTTS